jgi:ubiquinone/menaquinone biosynthesis C-methylase UbiE
LQDFWELGSSPSTVSELIESYVDLEDEEGEPIKILDLACGKGAVSVKIAENLEVKVKGIDIMSEFVDFAKAKAKEHKVSDLCQFAVADVTTAITKEKNYDVTILSAIGNVLGTPKETIQKLKSTIKKGGYIVIDEAYVKDDTSKDQIAYNKESYLTEQQWLDIFKQAKLEIVETVLADDIEDESLSSTKGMASITKRANELIEKHPDKRKIFEGYIESQQREYDDLDQSLVGVIWILHYVG